MPGISASLLPYACWDMGEPDQYQHYFYDDHDPDEDVFKSTAPSEDIWKKFELVPTPPMSPVRRVDETAVCPSLGDKLELVSHFLGQDDEQEAQCNLSSIILQDCMWSGFSATQRLEKAVSEHMLCQGVAKVPLVPQIPPSRSQSGHVESLSLNNPMADCVDPAAVLTFPLSGCKKQVSSGSESHTDSSDDEEIDVVTVEHKHGKSRAVNSRKPVTITVRADPHDPCTKRFHISIHQQQHNYAAPSPDLEPPRKRIRQETSQTRPGSTFQELESKPHTPVASVSIPTHSTTTTSSPLASSHHGLKSQPASPQSSDSEDMDRRKNHNFLERKRRNDLRSRFLALRDEIPGLVDCPKTPKVVILTKATEYLHLLHATDKQKAQEKKHLKNRHQQLLRRIAELKRF
ncbi:protein L-Myc-1b [Tachysurus fulvidraco]|uniref:protein L-Myc-1b n=1 Tax=Tachysurus fulvidraco TaxID=1234273 RepID=UPI001FEEFBCA|nr:protein L-Myc-1b [Tachysurus fulvidraco]